MKNNLIDADVEKNTKNNMIASIFLNANQKNDMTLANGNHDKIIDRNNNNKNQINNNQHSNNNFGLFKKNSTKKYKKNKLPKLVRIII